MRIIREIIIHHGNGENNMENKDWIKELKVGDKVFIEQRHGLSLTTVKTITKKGYIRTEYNYLFRNGTCRIDAYTSWDLKQCTPELENKFHFNNKIARMRKEIKNVDYSKVHHIHVDAIWHILNEHGFIEKVKR